MSSLLLLELTLGCALVSAAATGLVLLWLRRQAILDHPNDRSSHDRPVPRGAGLAVIPVILVAWTGLAALQVVPEGWRLLAVIVAAGGLAAVSWRDDRGGLPVLLRLAAQFLAIGLGLFGLPGAGNLFQGLLPAWLDLLATAVIWAWFVNLFNFMDGIDGIAGAQAVVLGLGVAAVTFVLGDQQSGGLYLGVALAAASLGFLPWNWQPARLFLGDVGSVPLGFLTGWLLLAMAGRGYWAPAVILPLYYLADATLTLANRALRLQKIWEPHREHVYQQAVQLGRSHAAVVIRVLLANLVLVMLALLAGLFPAIGMVAIIAAFVVVALLIVNLLRLPAAPGA
jgi:UDP-N-acetylmuramyl pentapeptide phosphotransferase/UDP-N-acetylglucosamine-1-phosphate transferase